MNEIRMRGSAVTDRPARYIRQLASHWTNKAAISVVSDVTVMRMSPDKRIELRVGDDRLLVDVFMPAGGDVAGFAEVVKVHLERFGTRDELRVAWEDAESPGSSDSGATASALPTR